MGPRLKQMTAEFMTHRHELTAFIHGLVRDAQTGEDIFQEVWIRLAEAGQKDTEILDTGKWCRGVARNLILHHWREKRTSKVVADSRIIDLASKAFDEAPSAGMPKRQRALVECVKGLPEKSREALRLRYEKGMKGGEIASAFKSNYDAVMRMLSRLRKALAKCVRSRLTLAGGIE